MRMDVRKPLVRSLGVLMAGLAFGAAASAAGACVRKKQKQTWHFFSNKRTA